MDCQEITETSIALKIMQNEDARLLRPRLFHCIYALFQGSFLNWINSKYRHGSASEKLTEDAKDAFQNGVTAFFLKSQSKDFSIRGSLKTTIYSFGLLQLLAYFKKDKLKYGVSDYVKWYQLFIEDETEEKETRTFLNEKEHKLLDAIKHLPEKHQKILIMKFFEKLKSKEIAEILHVSPGNIDNETTKAFKALRNALKPQYHILNQEYGTK
jgi:RNA polymerase sigma factor (sigma-70 family)